VLVCDPSRPTTRKVRFVSEHFSTHMLRADWEQAQPASDTIETKLIEAILPQIARADIVLLSDYAKGVLTARVIRHTIDAARKLGKPVIVDPKSLNWAIYRGATLLTPNRKEFSEATRSRADTPQSIVDASEDVMRLADCEAILVTQGEHGMTLVPRNGEAVHVPAFPVKVRDVSGAGDTVAAVLAVTLSAGADWETALRMANAAAAVAVGKKGTASVTSAELRRKILPHAFLAAEEKIVQPSAIAPTPSVSICDALDRRTIFVSVSVRIKIRRSGNERRTEALKAASHLDVTLILSCPVDPIRGAGSPRSLR
jgi:D-beta-D-heptose 7-phosphate kinase/D-beta-D-heptose 1-phosphate adenosyltransferase